MFLLNRKLVLFLLLLITYIKSMFLHHLNTLQITGYLNICLNTRCMFATQFFNKKYYFHLRGCITKNLTQKI